MKRFAVLIFALVLLLVPAAPLAAQGGSTTVTIVAFSDYHSHAVPFYSEGKPNQAGIARAIAYLKEQKAQPNTIVVSGGDTMNAGTPTWSDEYTCIEWPWFNGLVDVMAVGNHDFDYGADAFAQCQASADYPIISASLVKSDGTPYFQVDGKPYVVKEVDGVKIGFFALGGPDVQKLIKPENLPADTSWKDATATAQEVVDALRNQEKVNAVVFIGHELREDDEALAKAVPGIDLILGTHSHYKGELTRIPGTDTSYISPFQYLTYLSRVQLAFDNGKLAKVTGELVKMDESRPEDPEVAGKVAQLQKDLVARHPERFEVLGQAQKELSDANISTGESLIGNWATEVLRRAAGANAFFSTASSFRAAIPPGDITVEQFYTAIPYKNTVTTAEMTGKQLADLVALSVSKMGSDGFSQESGVRYAVQDGKPINIQVLKDPANPAADYAPLDPNATYTIGTTDFQAFVAGGYKDLFAQAQNLAKTDKDAHQTLIDAIKTGPITAELDGRTNATGPAPATLPTTGHSTENVLLLLVAGLTVLLGGTALRRWAPGNR
ncbi:MAG: 5'-nucleotidase C-terminal domain-containing protein [Ardenticatenaceae bacterium]|nr:5'-nucleotidase C-terminal domain-containing protein [Ardenticatenaceae bacterium]HBY94934.1 bifunctional metallophosphatase/5'-nucleotidase [Chloroflexota bacterium]